MIKPERLVSGGVGGVNVNKFVRVCGLLQLLLDRFKWEDELCLIVNHYSITKSPSEWEEIHESDTSSTLIQRAYFPHSLRTLSTCSVV